MMDFGFGSFLEKFQEFYGKRATKVLVGAIGISVLVFCIGLVWSTVVDPVWNWTSDTVERSSTAYLFMKFLQHALVAVLIFAFVTNISLQFDLWSQINEVGQIRDDAQDTMDEIKNSAQELDGRAADIERMTKEARSILKDTSDLLNDVKAQKISAEDREANPPQSHLDH